MAMKMMARALETHHQPADVARFLNAAARLMIAGQGAVLTLQKIRTGGKQTVVVQHVRVSEGGQAVIAGNMNANQPGASNAEGRDAKCTKDPIANAEDGSRTATHQETSLQLHDAARRTDAARPVSAPPCGMVAADSTAASAPGRKRPKGSSESEERD